MGLNGALVNTDIGHAGPPVIAEPSMFAVATIRPRQIGVFQTRLTSNSAQCGFSAHVLAYAYRSNFISPSRADTTVKLGGSQCSSD
jgi:hypothetical protein